MMNFLFSSHDLDQYQVLISKAFDIRELRHSSPEQHTDVVLVLPQIHTQLGVQSAQV